MGAAKEFDPSQLAYVPPTMTVKKTFDTPLVDATPENMKGYGHIVDSPEDCKIEIARWPAQGWCNVDENSGDQGQ